MPLFCFQIMSAGKITLVAADDENSRQQDADKYMISGKKKCQEDSDSDEKNGKSKLSLHGLSSFAERFLVYYMKYINIYFFFTCYRV